MPPPTRRAEVGASATSVEVRNALRINTMACAEARSTVLAIVSSEELNAPANSEVRMVAATAGAARGDGKEE